MNSGVILSTVSYYSYHNQCLHSDLMMIPTLFDLFNTQQNRRCAVKDQTIKLQVNGCHRVRDCVFRNYTRLQQKCHEKFAYLIDIGKKMSKAKSSPIYIAGFLIESRFKDKGRKDQFDPSLPRRDNSCSRNKRLEPLAIPSWALSSG